MATKKPAVAVPAVEVSAASDLAAIMAMMQGLQAQITAQAAAPAKAAKAAKAAKPKAAFKGGDLAKQLAGKPGVVDSKTEKGRLKRTAFCEDGSIVTIII